MCVCVCVFVWREDYSLLLYYIDIITRICIIISHADLCFLEKPNGAKKGISVIKKTESSIEIEWQKLTGISDVLKQYYGYLIEYKNDTTGASYREAASVNYTSSPYWKIEKLKSDTSYFIQMKPFRMLVNKKDYGSPYQVLQVKTSCGSK